MDGVSQEPLRRATGSPDLKTIRDNGRRLRDEWKARDAARQAEQLPLAGNYRGRDMADWMEIFAQTPLEWIPDRQGNLPVGRVVWPIEKPMRQAAVRWVSYGDWSDETGGVVGRMLKLAARARVA